MDAQRITLAIPDDWIDLLDELRGEEPLRSFIARRLYQSLRRRRPGLSAPRKPGEREDIQAAGRPRVEADFSGVDWTQSSLQIAEQVGCSEATVRRRRRELRDESLESRDGKGKA